MPGSEHSGGGASSPSALQQNQQPESQQQKPSVESAAARKTLSYKEAFWLATMGGAHAMGLQVRFAVSIAIAIMCAPSIARPRQQPDSQQQKPSVESAAARKPLSYEEASWLGTMGGAHALGLQVRFGVCPNCMGNCVYSLKSTTSNQTSHEKPLSEERGYQGDTLVQESFLARHKGRRAGTESAGALLLHAQTAHAIAWFSAIRHSFAWSFWRL